MMPLTATAAIAAPDEEENASTVMRGTDAAVHGGNANGGTYVRSKYPGARGASIGPPPAYRIPPFEGIPIAPPHRNS